MPACSSVMPQSWQIRQPGQASCSACSMAGGEALPAKRHIFMLLKSCFPIRPAAIIAAAWAGANQTAVGRMFSIASASAGGVKAGSSRFAMPVTRPRWNA